MRTPSAPSVTAAPEAASGARRLGTPMATALVVGNMIGSGVFLLPATLAGYGPISLVAFGLTAIGSVLLALVFARLGRAYPKTGGPYAYSRRAFGEFVGFQQAWGYWIAIWVGNAAIATAFVSYLAEYWGDLETNRPLAAGVALAAIWLLTAVNSLGVRHGGVVQMITTVMKFVPLAAVGVLGLLFVKSANFGPFNASGDSAYGAITAAATVTLWSFIGLESATVPAEDVADPDRTIPRSTMLGTLATSVVYLLGTFAVMGIVSHDVLVDSNAPFSDAAQEIFGGWGADVITICALASTFGALNGWILLQAQVPMAAARDGLFPAPFGRTGKSGAPIVGLVVSSVLVTLLMFANYNSSLADQFVFVLLLATLTTLVPYAFSAAAQLQLLLTDREHFVGAHLARDAIVAGLAFLYALWTIAGSGYQVVFRGFVLLMAGIPVFLWMTWHHAAREAGATEPTGVPDAAAPAPMTTDERIEELIS